MEPTIAVLWDLNQICDQPDSSLQDLSLSMHLGDNHGGRGNTHIFLSGMEPYAARCV